MLSIITLTFNNYHQLVETLNSIPNDNSVESVVVNGGQCIDTLNYLKSHKGKVISEKDDGISDAFNKGIYASTAEFIMILNSGDVLLNKDYLFRAERILKENCNVFFVHSNIIFEERYAGSLTMYPKMKNIGRGMPYLTETIVIKRSVFDLVGLYRNDYKFSMDYDLIVRMEKLGMKGQYLNEAPVVKVDGKGVSNTYEIKTMTETVKSLWENRHFNFSIVANLFAISKFL